MFIFWFEGFLLQRGLSKTILDQDFIYPCYVVLLIIFLLESEVKNIDLMGTDCYFSLGFSVRKMHLFPKLSPFGCVVEVGVFEF